MTTHYPPPHPDEQEPIALNPLLRGVDLAVDRLIRRDCFTERTLAILDELREELVKVSRPLPDREQIVDVLVMSPLADTAGTDLAPFNQTADAVLKLLEGEYK